MARSASALEGTRLSSSKDSDVERGGVWVAATIGGERVINPNWRPSWVPGVLPFGAGRILPGIEIQRREPRGPRRRSIREKGQVENVGSPRQLQKVPWGATPRRSTVTLKSVLGLPASFARTLSRAIPLRSVVSGLGSALPSLSVEFSTDVRTSLIFSPAFCVLAPLPSTRRRPDNPDQQVYRCAVHSFLPIFQTSPRHRVLRCSLPAAYNSC